MNKQEWARKVKGALAEQEISLNDLAAATRYSRTYLSSALNGRQEVLNRRLIASISNYLQIEEPEEE